MDVAETAERIHIDDTPTVATTERTMLPDESTVLHYQFRAKDGSYHWLEDHYQIVADAEERPRYRIGVMLGITAQKTQEEPCQRLSRVRAARTAIPRALANVLSEPHRTALRRHGLKIAALAVALVQLVAGAGIYRIAERVMTHTQTSAIQIANDAQKQPAPRRILRSSTTSNGSSRNATSCNRGSPPLSNGWYTYPLSCEPSGHNRSPSLQRSSRRNPPSVRRGAFQTLRTRDALLGANARLVRTIGRPADRIRPTVLALSQTRRTPRVDRMGRFACGAAPARCSMFRLEWWSQCRRMVLRVLPAWQGVQEHRAVRLP